MKASSIKTIIISLLTAFMCISALSFGYGSSSCTPSCQCDPCECNPCSCDHQSYPSKSQSNCKYEPCDYTASGCPMYYSECDPCCQDNDFCPITGKYPHGPLEDYTCCCDSDLTFFAGVELLWWLPCIPGLEYALVFEGDSVTPPFVGNVAAAGKYKAINHEWDPGFRVRAGLLDVSCNWNVYFSYVYMTGIKSKTLEEGPRQTLFSPIVHGGLTEFDINSILGNSRYRYQTFDVLFGKDLCLQACYTWAPYFGIEGLKFDQLFRSVVQGEENQIEESVSLRWESNYQALGLKLGSIWTYRPFNCFELFSEAAISVLAGCHADENIQSILIDDGSTVTTQDFKISSDEMACTPGLYLRAGFNYVYTYCEKEFVFTLGYEFVNWFNMQQIRRYTSDETGFGVSTLPLGSRVGFSGVFIGFNVSI